ncbi:MAG TPA: hypothetical protein VGG85_20295 [Terracidiphilus sp.]|jgi:hypothetical protein
MTRLLVNSLLLLSSMAPGAFAQNDPAPQESRYSTRYSVAVIDDATFYGNLRAPLPAVLNQVLVEPTFSLKYDSRWTFTSAMVGAATTYTDTASQVRVKETYAGLSAGDFDFMVGRKMLRWGTGYAFTSAGVLDPPRNPTDPGDRLNLNEGRDMVKADWVRGPHAISAAWSTAELARKGMTVHDTTAIRYNVLVHGFDTSLIAGNDRGGDSFGALTFTRVLGEAWEIHGEATWRERQAILLGAKYTTTAGITFIGEFYTPPNTPYYRSLSLSPTAGRQHYGFINAGKSRLRELPGWKEWDVSGSIVTNFDDRSYSGIVDVNRWFGKHVSTYLHLDVPVGAKQSEFGAAPYSAATSAGIRFQL